ncbi:MAG: hypothetical protein ACKO37_00325, partial [Vampirovibrionales bacterium]
GKSSKEIMNDLMASAPHGTKAQTMHSVYWGGATLDDVTKAQTEGRLIIGHELLGQPSVYPPARFKPDAQIWD